jgi:hypothetical protein
LAQHSSRVDHVWCGHRDIPFESAVRGSLERSRDDRVPAPQTRRATITPTALHHYQGRNSARAACPMATRKARAPPQLPTLHRRATCSGRLERHWTSLGEPGCLGSSGECR